MDPQVERLYTAAMDALRQADSQVGAEDLAEDLLLRAIEALQASSGPAAARSAAAAGGAAGGRKRKLPPAAAPRPECAELLGDMHMTLGRVVEWKDAPKALAAYSKARAAMPQSPEANFHLARLQVG